MSIMYAFHHMIVSLLTLALLLILNTSADGSPRRKNNNHGVLHVKGVVGAIIDMSSRIGREQRVAMEIAKKDFYRTSNQTLVLHIIDSHREQPIRAALAAIDLINTQQVQAILGPQTWEEASLVAEISSQTQVPILSLADTTPKWATERWPYLLQASANKQIQMKAIAAIVQSWDWHQVTVIYEDTDSSASGVTPYLFDALRDVGAEIVQVLALPPFASTSLSGELKKLKREQCRVFVVHLSLPLAVRLFEKAKKMKMMEKDSVWITTDPITSLVHSINASTISSMKGIVGVKSYFPERGPHFPDFDRRFRKKFRAQYPEEDNNEPGIYAAEAYDAVWTMAIAMNGSNQVGGEKLLENIFHEDFQGLSGEVQFINQKAPTDIFQIINVNGKSYGELGFWSNGLGFSETIHKNAVYNSSMIELGQVLWPGGPTKTPWGWSIATSANPLRIGVPGKSGYREFVHVEYDHLRNNNESFSGFAIEVFKETLERLPFNLPYKFIAFNGSSYDELVKQVYLKNYDAVVGDVVILASRYQYAEFTNPYTETGLVLIVPDQSSNEDWSFIKPFTKSMWVLIAVITVYNGFIIWLIERNYCPTLKGSMLNQIGIMLWLSFNTLFSLHGGKMHSNLSRMSMVVWLFVALVIIQTYTANLASMLTVQKLEPTVPNVEALLNGNAVVGYCTGSYLQKYLVDVLHFKTQNIKNYTSLEDYAQAFKTKEIAAVFLEVPLAKVFLAKYCRRFVTVGPTYKVGGFGFVFPRGSPLLPSIDEALLKVSEVGTLLELERRFIAPQNCPDADDKNHSLSPNSFGTLFIITAGTSTISLAIYIFNTGNSVLGQTTAWRLMLAAMKHWRCQKQLMIRRLSNAGSSENLGPRAAGMQSHV